MYTISKSIYKLYVDLETEVQKTLLICYVKLCAIFCIKKATNFLPKCRALV